MTEARIHEIMMDKYAAEFIGSYEAEDHPETGGSIFIYENARLQIRYLVEIDPGKVATLYTFHQTLQ